MSAGGLARLGVRCSKASIGIGTLGIFCLPHPLKPTKPHPSVSGDDRPILQRHQPLPDIDDSITIERENDDLLFITTILISSGIIK